MPFPFLDQSLMDDRSYFGFQSGGLNFGTTPDKQFPNVSFVPTGMTPVRAIETVGEEFPTASQHGIIESDIAVKGDVIDFVGVCYALEAFYGTVSPSTVGVTGKQRIYTPSSTKPILH